MKTFQVLDTPRSSEALPEELRSTTKLPYISDIYKVLMGRADIKRVSSGNVYKCRYDFVFETHTNGIIGSKGFISRITEDSASRADFLREFSRLKRDNVEFYKNLRQEICHCIVALLDESYVESFVYLYRSIEKIAIAFPLLYISSIPDFHKAKEALESLFKSDSGELAFASKFANLLSKNREYLSEYKVSFYTEIENVDEFNILIKELNRCCPDTFKEDTEVYEDEGYFSMDFSQIPSLIVNVRNRLFHNSNSGQANFNIDKIGGAEELCRMMVYGGLHWITLVYGEVVRERLRKI